MEIFKKNSIILLMGIFDLLSYYAINGEIVARSSCCRRISNYANVGIGTTGRFIKLDVGMCTSVCSGENNFGHYISVLERIKVKQNTPTCITGMGHKVGNCKALLSHTETVLTDQGQKQVNVIDDCDCQITIKKCSRVSKFVHYFPGTDFAKTVDVGKCQGGCDKKKCRPTKISKEVLVGPDGPVNIHKVIECKCESTCYRQHYNVAITEKVNDSKNGFRLKTKIVDIGKCTGTCSPIEKCVMKANRSGTKPVNDKRCMMSLETSDVTCAPVRVNHVTYVDRKGEQQTLTKIRRCGCI